MIDHELEFNARRIADATTPEEVFGLLGDDPLNEAKRLYRRLARILHPDKYQDDESKAVANDAYTRLNTLWVKAQERINKGVYNQGGAGKTVPDSVTVTTRKRSYTVKDLLTQGDIANLYHCTFDGQQGILKVSRDPADNDLVVNEARILRLIRQKDSFERFHPYVPELIESFGYKDADGSGVRQANVLSVPPGLYSLKEIRDHYAQGVNPRDMAWMWRRLLVGLGFIHQKGVIHGAILPTHILIQPEDHGLVLIDWSYAVQDPATTGERISAISQDYEAWYPSEVMNKETPLPGLDIFMAAECMVYVLGGDPIRRTFPSGVPQQLRAFLRGTLLDGPKQRPQDAWKLNKEFDELIERLWGSRKFHHFSMPPRK